MSCCDRTCRGTGAFGSSRSLTRCFPGTRAGLVHLPVLACPGSSLHQSQLGAFSFLYSAPPRALVRRFIGTCHACLLVQGSAFHFYLGPCGTAPTRLRFLVRGHHFLAGILQVREKKAHSISPSGSLRDGGQSSKFSGVIGRRGVSFQREVPRSHLCARKCGLLATRAGEASHPGHFWCGSSGSTPV